jgi:hypothetical protein
MNTNTNTPPRSISEMIARGQRILAAHSRRELEIAALRKRERDMGSRPTPHREPPRIFA